MIILLAGLMLGSGRPAAAQEFFRPDPKYNPGRVNGVVIAEAAIGTAVTIGLNYLWYKKFPHSKFHMFNDNNEWLSMDKMGHATTAYNIAAIQSDLPYSHQFVKTIHVLFRRFDEQEGQIGLP